MTMKVGVDKNKPTYQVHVLHQTDLGGIDASFTINKWKPGLKRPVPTYSYLITGEDIGPILIDTGVKEGFMDIMHRLDMTATQTEDMTYKAMLGKLGYKLEDVKAILHTHLHIDHAGNDNLFPNAKIIMPRKELMFAVADLMDEQYPAEYIGYLVEQIHVPGKVRLIDCDHDLIPGVFLELTDGHTWGSMNIKVNTKQGLANICGDVIYDETLQCRKNDEFEYIEAHNQYEYESYGDRSTGNYWNLWAAKREVQKIITTSDVILPIHDPIVPKKYGYLIG